MIRVKSQRSSQQQSGRLPIPFWLVRLVIYCVVAGIMVGCGVKGCSGRKDIPPEDQLHSYISKAVNIVETSQRKELVDLTTGSLKSALINASEESFRRAYIEKKYDFRSFEIISRSDLDEGKATQIDFKLVYKTYSPGEEPKLIPVTETTNRATLVYEHGRWALSKVESLETNFEWENGIPVGRMTEEDIRTANEVQEVLSTREEMIEEATEAASDK